MIPLAYTHRAAATKAPDSPFAALSARNRSVWQLPTYDGTKSYQNLLVGVYGGTSGNGGLKAENLDSTVQAAPTNLIHSGCYGYDSGKSINLSAEGNYWISSTSSIINTRKLNFYPTALLPQNTTYKGYGFSVRCLVC